MGDIFIGGEKWNGGRILQPMHGDLVALEVYVSNNTAAENSELPQYLQKLIHRDQMVTDTRNDEPPVKKSKKSQSDYII